MGRALFVARVACTGARLIPLRIRVEGAQGEAAFVVRLSETSASDATAVGPWDAVLAHADRDAAFYESRHGQLRVSGVSAPELHGDVVLVDPNRSVAHRLIRAQSMHNTFLVTERCDQLCVMCSQPPKAHHTDLFQFFLEAALLAPEGMTIGISGGEPTLYKTRLFELLRRALSARPDLSFHILTNGQHFGSEDEAALSSLASGKVLWGIPLYASEPALHDEIVAKPGAHERLLESLALLARCGSAIELRTVLMSVNAANLESLADFVAIHLPFVSFWAIMQLENIGYGRKNWDQLFFDNSKSFEPVGQALDVATARGMPAALYNFPLCTVPEAYRRLAHPSISDWKRRYPEPCKECRLRDSCGGFFAWYPDDRGFAGVQPL